MVRFTATAKRFGAQGEKTGWTCIEITAAVAEALNPGTRKSYRVKGALDDVAISQQALIPMGGGSFVLPLNAALRQLLKKKAGEEIHVRIAVDTSVPEVDAEFLACLHDEPAAVQHFEAMPRSHQLYYSNWICSAKTDATKAKRIAQAVTALSKGRNYAQMMQEQKAKNPFR